jgi:hypothetical protein
MSLQPSNPNWNPTSSSGFLLDNGGNVTGAMMFLDVACSGVGNVSGNVSGSTVAFSIAPTGLNMEFNGSLTQSSTMSGNYTILSAGCSGTTSSPQTGTWTANLVTPLNSSNLQGTFVSKAGITYQFTGSVSQGSNTGQSSGNLSGAVAVDAATPYCFLTAANMSGSISGIGVVLNIFGSSGAQIGQITGTTSIDGTLVTGTYRMLGLGTGAGVQAPCIHGDSGTVSFTL